MGDVGYADDLDRFISGQILFEEIQGFIHEDVPVQEAITLSLINALFYNSKEEHDLYEKLCYPKNFHSMQSYKHEELYAIYLFQKAYAFRTNWIEKVRWRRSKVNREQTIRIQSRGHACMRNVREKGDITVICSKVIITMIEAVSIFNLDNL